MKKLIALMVPVFLTFAACAAEEGAPADDENVGEVSESLTASCSADYHPIAWCDGSIAKVKCVHDNNPNQSNNYRSVNCGAQNKRCRDAGSSAHCVN